MSRSISCVAVSWSSQITVREPRRSYSPNPHPHLSPNRSTLPFCSYPLNPSPAQSNMSIMADLHMKGCRHAGWVEVSDTADVRLVDPRRLHRLVSSLDNPDCRHPQILVCIGGEVKRRAIGHLFHKHDFLQSQTLHGLANLHIDASCSHLEHPVLFADCTPEAETRWK